MPTLKTVTLGCKVNQYETEYVRGGLATLGYREAVDGQPADLCLVNTCTVTAEADLKSRKAIRQIARENPAAEIIVMGCYATRAAEELEALRGVVEVVTDKRQLPDLLARLGVTDVPEGIASFGRRHRAYVKVQDGCRMQCSYCIIPKVRPTPSSRRPEDVLAEIRRLVEGGHREIVLTGIHLGHYGVELREGDSKGTVPFSPTIAARSCPENGDNPQGDARGGAKGTVPFSLRENWDSPPLRENWDSPRLDLAGLVRRILSVAGDFRLRMSSIEAVEVTEELVALIAGEPERICPHLHVPMQSGSDAVLGRMRRRWASRQFAERCHWIRQSLDEPALTTDVIVGFPGETEADFEATCRAVEEIGFSKLHVFRFSPRRGTAAADMPDQVPPREKNRRAEELGRIGRRLRDQFLQRLRGRRLRVLVERSAPGQLGLLHGTACRYVPVELPGPPSLLGRIVPVTAATAVGGRVRAAEPRE